MAFILTASKSCFVVLVFVLFTIILVIWFADLAPEEITVLWYAMIAVIALVVVAWIVYRHQKDLLKERENPSTQAGKGPSSHDEPKIGHTYQGFDGDKRDHT
jgi:archaellum biogenesis protein FlaJ (TadC family)